MFQAQIWLTGCPNELHLCLFAPSLQIPMVAEPITKAQVGMAECSREKAVAEAGIQTKSQRIQSPGRIQVKFRSVQVNKSWFWIISSSCISQAPVGHEVARKATWHLSHRQRSTKNGRRQSYMNHEAAVFTQKNTKTESNFYYTPKMSFSCGDVHWVTISCHVIPYLIYCCS